MILEGTTSSGAVVPVQVTTDGKVVAEGMTGPQGPEGPEGPKGDKGDKGDPGSPGNLWSGSDPGPISYTGGSVGIGNTSPDQRLHVANTADNTKLLVSSGFEAALELQNGGGSELNVINSAGTGNLSFRVSNSEKMRMDSSGRLLVGTSTSRSVDNEKILQIEGTSQQTSSMSLTRNTNNNGPPNISFGKSRGTTTGSNTIVQNGDALGIIVFCGADGTDSNSRAASISSEVDGTPGDGDMPGRLVFSTSSSGAGSPTTRMTIFSDGAVAIEEYLVLKAPDGSRWAVEVDNTGNLITSLVI